MIQQNYKFIPVLLSMIISTLLAASPKDSLKVQELDTATVVIFDDDPVLVAMEQSWEEQGKRWLAFTADSVALNTNHFAADSMPVYADIVYARRLVSLNEQKPMDLDNNKKVKAYINV